MARATRRQAGGRAVTSSLKGLIESIADRVADRMGRTVAGKDEIRALEREVRDLSRRVGRTSAPARPGGRRPGRPPSNRVCKVKGCGLKHVAQGYCSKHYQGWRRKQLEKAKA